MYPFDICFAAPNSAIDSYYELPGFDLGQVNWAVHSFHTAGGKGLNAARALKNLGGQPLCTGIVGGSAGQFIVQELDREGIAHDLVWAAGETRRCNTIHILGQADTTVILENGTVVAESAADQFTARVLADSQSAPFTALLGSLPTGFPVDYYARLVTRLKDQGVRVCLDCSGEPLRLAAQAAPWMVKVNRDEIDSAFPGAGGRDLDFELQVFAELHRAGLELLVITHGNEGAHLFSAQEVLQVQTRVEGLVSTAGSGDTFLSALLLGLGRGEPLAQAAVLASAAAAANTQQLGCGFFSSAMVEALRARTQLKTLVMR